MNPTSICPKCASPLPADDPQGHCPHCLKPGVRFNHGRYTLYEPLAIDRIGVLWRACDEHLDGFVTLRFLAHDLRSDRAAMEGIRLELERARRLLHPNIARVHELHEDADEPAYVVSEWVKGESLTSRLQQQPQERFTWPEAEPWLLQLVQALHHAHREGVLHGNLTAADVRLDHEGRLKVSGFGFACLSGVVSPGSSPAADARAQTGWSPQQHTGLFAEVADDIYALGALGYELLSGRPPFYLGDVAEQACHAPPQPLQDRLADFNLDNPVPPHVAAALLACLAKERTERPATVTDFVQTFAFGGEEATPAPAVAEEPAAVIPAIVQPSSPAPAHPPRPPVQWRRVALAAGVALALLFVGLGVAWLRSFKSSSQALVAGAMLVAEDAKPTNTTGNAHSPPIPAPVQPSPVARNQPFTNSLGMPFVPVPNTESGAGGSPVRFCRWLTRVQDFEAFVRATGHDATNGVMSFGAEGWKAQGHTWRAPGFEQTPMHPVSGVNWEDAQAFAKWLTDKERAEGRLAPGERYRLPYDWEWSVAVGLAETRDGLPKDRNMWIKNVFPWGTQWPPPAGAGNYGNFIAGYRDGFERSSPVGSFAANRFGLHDMGGNLWQWCEDWFDAERVNRPLRGGSWGNDPADTLWSSFRHYIPPNRRFTSNGFRVVLAHEPNSSTSTAFGGHEIVGYYGVADKGGTTGTVLRIADKAPVSKGDRIRVTGMGPYDGEWEVLQAFPYQGPNDTRPLWGYWIGAPRQVVPGFTGQGGPSVNRARLFPVTLAGGAATMAATNPSSASAARVLAPAGTRGPGSNLPASKNETLWNEKSDFAHWRGEAKYWSIENGILTGRMTSGGQTHLTWTGSPVEDFELVLVFRTKGDGQATVRYRTGDVPSKNTGELICYSAILNERTIRAYPATERSPLMTQYVGRLYASILGADGLSSGRSYGPLTNASLKLLKDTLQLYGRSELIPLENLNPGTPAPADGTEWSELVINAQARRLAHWRNGRLVTAVLDSDFPTAAGPSTLPDAPGGIQLQLHNYLPGKATPAGMSIEVQFKEIRLTRLPKVPPVRITNTPPIMVPVANPPRPIRLEAEQWLILEQQDCKASPQTMTAFGAQLWSGGKQLFCGSGARGLIALNLPVERAGRYRLELLTTVAPDFGMFQVSVNGQKLGPVVDGYGRTVRPANRISLGPVPLAAGNNRLQFQITGKNPLSTGYYMGLDCVDLNPAAP